MRYILTPKEMSFADKMTIEKHFVPSMVLMEKAAMAVAKRCMAANAKRVLVVCGTGNNGADGLAVARLLMQQNIYAECLILGDIAKGTTEFKNQYEIIKSYGIKIADTFMDEGFDLIVDAIFGIGLSRSIEGKIAEVINKINASKARVISVDISSGLSADDGRVYGVVVKADETVTFAYEKYGHYLGDGKKYTGNLVVTDIGIRDDSFFDMTPKAAIFEQEDLTLLNSIEIDSHKKSNGRLLVIAGSKTMEGAAFLSAKAAAKTGCGIITVYTHEDNVGVLHTQLPEAIIKGYKTFDKNEVCSLLEDCDALLIGPGLSTESLQEEIFTTVLRYSNVPMVIDADGLNLLSRHLELLDGIHPDIILTPHIGEMVRLSGENSMYIKEHVFNAATSFANKYQVTVCLKSHCTVTAIPYSISFINDIGNQGMATAGSGDVLAGIIAGLLSQGNSPKQSASAGVYIHSKSADSMIKYTGIRGLMASDIITGIDDVLK